MTTVAPKNSVSIITASAGTGKTTDLTERIFEEIKSGRAPNKILATTFTVKAAEELKERTREKLIKEDRSQAAVELLGARIGTINGVCGGLVKEFAFGLGLSPIVDVIDEKASKIIFRKSADLAIGKYAKELQSLAKYFGYDDAFKSSDWRDDVIRVISLARSNNINHSNFAEFTRRSFEGFDKFLKESLSGETSEILDAKLDSEINNLLNYYSSYDRLTVGTKKSLESIKEIVKKNRNAKYFPWQNWAKLAKIEATAADDANFYPLRQAAVAFSRHPRLKNQIKEFIQLIFACAAESMVAYETYKKSWGLVDFVDQDRLMLDLMQKPELRQQLSERIESVFIDEFQDTSPLQLTNFISLSQIASSSIWVGDQKQAIYGFRGTDPDLITHVAPKIQETTQGVRHTLSTNYRSRPSLVQFFNDAFGPTFRNMGLPEAATKIDKCYRQDLEGQSTALNIWHSDKDFYRSIAAGVFDVIKNSQDYIISDEKSPRPIFSGDIAILSRTNDNCLKIALNLAALGLKVAVERGGLFRTLEARLVIAALKWCADQKNTVSLVELAHMLHVGDSQPAWFEASLQENSKEEILKLIPLASDLEAIARSSLDKTPRELIDSVLGVGGILQALKRWGNYEDRLLNLEALRELVCEYEEERRRTRAPTTATDLCIWLDEQEDMQPESRSRQAITVLTYHAAKGLEWPLVILTDLDAKPKANAFGINLVSDVPGDQVDWKDPLNGRWIRFWPWPLGSQKTNVDLDTAAVNTAEGKAAVRIEREERARLLYVGATRARDYLVLALPKTTKGYPWLDELVSDHDEPVLMVPRKDEISAFVNGNSHAVCIKNPIPIDNSFSDTQVTSFNSPAASVVSFSPLSIRPSNQEGLESARIVREIDLGARLPLTGASDMTLVGDALHRFLAADDVTWPNEAREALARRILQSWKVTALDARDIVTMSSRFKKFINEEWPEAILHRESPIVWRDGDRTLSGRIDVYLELPEKIVVIDHKSFPGDRSQWLDQAKKYAAQLKLYADAINASLPEKKIIELALHLPVSGQMLIIDV